MRPPQIGVKMQEDAPRTGIVWERLKRSVAGYNAFVEVFDTDWGIRETRDRIAMLRDQVEERFQ